MATLAIFFEWKHTKKNEPLSTESNKIRCTDNIVVESNIHYRRPNETNIESKILVGTKINRRYRMEPNETKPRIGNLHRNEDQSSLSNGTKRNEPRIEHHLRRHEDQSSSSNGTKRNETSDRRSSSERRSIVVFEWNQTERNLESNIIFVGTKINRRHRMEPNETNLESNIIFVGTKINRRHRMEPNETKPRIGDLHRNEDQSSLSNGTKRNEPRIEHHLRRHEDQSSSSNGTKRNETSDRRSSSERRSIVVFEWNQTERNLESNIIFVGTKINRRHGTKRNLESNIIFVGTKINRRHRMEPSIQNIESNIIVIDTKVNVIVGSAQTKRTSN